MLQLLADLSTGSFNTNSSSTSLGSGFWVGYGIFLVVMYLVSGFIMSRIFKKAGRAPGAAFVPIYNTWVLLELGGESGAHVFWVLLPFVGPLIFLVFYIKAMLELARRFGKGPVFAIVGLIIFSLIGFIILAFDDSRYQSEVSHGVLDTPYPSGSPAPQPIAPPVTPPSPPTVTDVPPASTPDNAPDAQPPQPPEPPQPPVSGPPTGPVSG